MPPRTKDPATCCEVSERNIFGYNESSQLWESVQVTSGRLNVNSYVQPYGGIPLLVKKYQGIASLSGQNFSANITGTTWCPTAVSIKDYGTVGWAVGNSTGTDPIVAIQFRWYFGDSGTGWSFDGPITNLPGGAHINSAQFYVSLDGTFNDPHARVAYGFMSCKIGVRLTTGGTPQNIDVYPRGIYT